MLSCLAEICRNEPVLLIQSGIYLECCQNDATLRGVVDEISLKRGERQSREAGYRLFEATGACVDQVGQDEIDQS